MNWKKDNRVLRDGIRRLARAKVRNHPLALVEQPFDSHLLRASPLFLRSRKTYLAQGGKFYPTVVSSPRTLSSPILLEQEVEYTPIERELIWAATDPIESSNPSRLNRLLQIRLFCTSLFHEQNHRLLWHFLPPPELAPRNGSARNCSPRNCKDGVSRYLNFVESLVIATDMALGDQLGHGGSRVFYLAGLTYDPGTDILTEGLSSRAYRNYLQICLYTTYLKLQFFDSGEIQKITDRLFPAASLSERKLKDRATARALRLDDAFVRETNPAWQEKHLAALIRKFGTKSSAKTLQIPEDPFLNHAHYLWAERWFDTMKIG